MLSTPRIFWCNRNPLTRELNLKRLEVENFLEEGVGRIEFRPPPSPKAGPKSARAMDQAMGNKPNDKAIKRAMGDEPGDSQ